MESGDIFPLNIYGLFEETCCNRLNGKELKIVDLGFSEIW